MHKKPKNVLVVDPLGKSQSRRLLTKYARANTMSIGPQIVAVWCSQLGHNVNMVYYDGPEILAGTIPDDIDVVFINSFSQTALLAYALSAYFRSKGAITVIGGPHPRSYPDHSIKYFDYALGFTTKELLKDILDDPQKADPHGVYLTADKHPSELPLLEERWPFMKDALDKAPFVKMVPVIGSLGCPYTCSFCTDATVGYQPLKYESLTKDLQFIHKQNLSRAYVAWHDPNFAIRFDDYLSILEEAVPPGSLSYFTEMSLSLLSEKNCKRMAKAGIKIVAPGIESWYDIGEKSKSRSVSGYEKMKKLAEHVNMVSQYIPYVQTNLILGLDADEGKEPFELTKRFVDLAPGVYPYFSLLTAYGRNAPDNIRYQQEGRVLNIPFHFLNQIHGMNIIPKNYEVDEFYENACDLLEYVYSNKAMAKRFLAVKDTASRLEMAFRGWGSERGHKLKNYRRTLGYLKDENVKKYYRGETQELPEIFLEPIQRDLQWLWEWLPKDSIYHNPNAYLDELNGKDESIPKVRKGKAVVN